MLPSRPSIVFVLGGPGAGKSTQCKFLVEAFDFVHLSAGELLRQEQASQESRHGQLIRDCIANGSIVPAEVTIDLLRKAMALSSGCKRFLIDGFPRNEENNNAFIERLLPEVDLHLLLNFDCPDDIREERLCGRDRDDDTRECIRKRFTTFREQTTPVIESYRLQNIVVDIAAHESVEVVKSQLEQVFKKHFPAPCKA